MNFDFEAKADEVAKEFNIGNADLYEIQEGDNQVRVLSGYDVVARHWQGKGEDNPVCFGEDKGCPWHERIEGNELKYPLRIRCIFWLLDRRDDKIKLAFMPYKFASAIGKLQKDKEWGFEQVPMPYDVNFTAEGVGDRDVEYAMVPVPSRKKLSNEVIGELALKKTPEEIAAGMKQRARENFEAQK